MFNPYNPKVINLDAIDPDSSKVINEAGELLASAMGTEEEVQAFYASRIVEIPQGTRDEILTLLNKVQLVAPDFLENRQEFFMGKDCYMLVCFGPGTDRSLISLTIGPAVNDTPGEFDFPIEEFDIKLFPTSGTVMPNCTIYYNSYIFENLTPGTVYKVTAMLKQNEISG